MPDNRRQTTTNDGALGCRRRCATEDSIFGAIYFSIRYAIVENIIDNIKQLKVNGPLKQRRTSASKSRRILSTRDAIAKTSFRHSPFFKRDYTMYIIKYVDKIYLAVFITIQRTVRKKFSTMIRKNIGLERILIVRQQPWNPKEKNENQIDSVKFLDRRFTT